MSPLRTCRRQYPGRSDGTCSLVQFHSLRPSHELWAGRLLHHYFRGLLSVHPRYSLHARRVALATLCTRGFSSLVASTAALIATGWSEPVPGRVYPPLWTSAFTAHQSCPSLGRNQMRRPQKASVPPGLKYHHVGAFSSKPLSGNGVTVFRLREALYTAVMQELTRERRQFESIFVLQKARSQTVRAWIFTHGRRAGLCWPPK
jgi:Phenazine biosynthesis-like protein